MSVSRTRLPSRLSSTPPGRGERRRLSSRVMIPLHILCFTVDRVTRGRTQGLAVAYLSVSVAAMAIYAFASPVWQKIILITVAWTALVLAVTFGLRRAAPGNRMAWWLLTAALFAGNLSGLARRVPELMVDKGLLQLADATGNALFLATAMTVVARRGRNDRGGLIEAAIFSAAVGGVLCAVVILPNLAEDYRTPMGETFIAVTMLLLYGVVGALLRLWQTGHRRPIGLMMTAVVLNLAGQTALSLYGQRTIIFTQICFIGAYTAVGLFSGDSRSQRLAEPGLPPDDHLNRPRLFWLGIAVAAMPACAALPALSGRPANGVLIAVCGTAIAVLVMMRIGLLSAQRRLAEKQLQHLAEHDPLTGALNRRGFIDRLHAAQATRSPAVLAFCDLDDFKEVNDRFGHAAGDDLLIQITRRIRRSLRPADAVGRIGGDEFLVLFSDTPEGALPGVRDRLAAVFRRPFKVGGNDLAITASVGAVAVIPDALAKADDLLRHADLLMYQAKSESRG